MKQLINLKCDASEVPDIELPTQAHFSSGMRRVLIMRDSILLHNNDSVIKIAISDLFSLAESKEPKFKALTKEEMRARRDNKRNILTH